MSTQNCNGVRRVTTKRQISVTAWSASPVPVVSPRSAHRQYLPPFVIGLVGTLLLHGLVLQTVVLGSRAHRIRPPDVQDPGSSLNKLAATPADALVFIDLPKTTTTTEEIDEALASIRAELKDSPIPKIRLDPSPPRGVEILAFGEDMDPASDVDIGDSADRARLYGIYTGQMRARIERAWRRPRTPVQEVSDSTKSPNIAEYFHCQVQIVQDSSGNVQEILLPKCNGSVAWQHSLVLAIQQASPLPAPPSPKVFSPAIELEFVGYEYVVGGPDDEYETASPGTLQATISIRH